MNSLYCGKRQKGQTLIIAVSVLGLLLVLGFVLIGIVGTNIKEAVRFNRRTIAQELAEAGIRFAHHQLIYSELGADWRYPDQQEKMINKDPDALYLRSSSGLNNDLGGPDGLGPYYRISFKKGRALVRVRPAFINISGSENLKAEFREFSNLIQPEKARGQIIIESIGRSGFIKSNDPTTLLNKSIPIKTYSSLEEQKFIRDFRYMKAAEKEQKLESRKYMAIASIGLIENMRFISNKYQSIRSAELGYLSQDFGAYYGDKPVKLTTFWGSPQNYAPLWCNGDLEIFGDNQIYLDPEKGYSWAIAGKLWANGILNTPTSAGQTLFERTGRGAIRTGEKEFDTDAYPRAITRKEPPSVLTVNPETKKNRFYSLTRDSDTGNLNYGFYGYGKGIYIDCDERGTDFYKRSQLGDPTKSLTHDWLNPHDALTQGWEGPYYKPIATTIRLANNGFDIIRDSRSKKPLWFDPLKGALTRYSKARYELDQGKISNNIVQYKTDFNGVIFCEGDIRIRGIIPDHTPLTVVSMGTIYIDGSIIKGTDTSSLMLMAKDYVTLNTTQFFAPKLVHQNLQMTKIGELDAIELIDPQQNLTLQTQFLLDPIHQQPYVNHYFSYGNQTVLYPSLLLSHAASSLRETHIALNIKPIGELDFASYLFDREPVTLFPLKGFWANALPLLKGGIFNNHFLEQTGYGSYKLAFKEDTEFQFHLGYHQSHQPSEGYRLARMAIAPHDVRIEAGIYAEEGSFFVIPGRWFNVNRNDTRLNFINQLNLKENNAEDFTEIRKRLFGHDALIPFFGEPLNIRITIHGAISENMPASMSQQAEWQRKWGWMPGSIGSSGIKIPEVHVPQGWAITKDQEWAPNLILTYDPVFSDWKNHLGIWIRKDSRQNILPPMPHLPVSSSLSYFGEVKK